MQIANTIVLVIFSVLLIVVNTVETRGNAIVLLLYFTPRTVDRSIAMSVPTSLYLSVCLSAHCLKTTCTNFTRFSVHVAPVPVAQSSSDDFVMRYVLPVLEMTSFFHAMAIFKIGEHLAKLRAKSLTVIYTPFALHFYRQRCRSRQIS